MTETAETLEQELVRDLAPLGERLARDEEFCADLYRALANNRWRKEGGPDGHVALSWSRAEALVNDLRTGEEKEALVLAQTGGEGEVSDLMRDELGRLGWTSEPLDTSEHDPEHLSQPESPPPPETGERDAPVEDPHAWEREAHAAADEHLEQHPAKRVERARDGGGNA